MKKDFSELTCQSASTNTKQKAKKSILEVSLTLIRKFIIISSIAAFGLNSSSG
jgi:hypothetical protein